MKSSWSRPAIVAVALAVLSSPGATLGSDEDFFEAQIRPLLAKRCYECHSDKKQQGEVRLDQREAVLSEGPAGRIVVPGKPDESRLLQVLAYDPLDAQMPPKGKLPDAEIELLTRWIEKGAPWPETVTTPSQRGSDGYDYASLRDEHWAFRPVTKPTPPAVSEPNAVRSPVDAYVLARLEEHGLTFAPPAPRRTLLRRVYVDLVGVPPTPEQVAAFEADESPDAFSRVVDELLSSPLYGQRWGRHWLDVARYADTKGYVFTEDINYPYAYTYRDYVVNAFNSDTPYDRFVVEQLAADKLGLDDGAPELAALGFLTVGRRNQNNRHDIIDDRIDVTTRGLLGLTVACARCHDHKFDPVPTADYYSLYGVFDSSDEPDSGELPLIGMPEKTAAYKRFQQELAKRQGEVTAYIAQEREKISAEMRRNAGDYLLETLGRTNDNPELRRRAVSDWERLVSRATNDDAIWGPWKQLSALPAEGFAEKAAAAIEQMRQETGFRDGFGRFILDRVASQPLERIEDVANAYSRLLTETIEKPAELSADDADHIALLTTKLNETGLPFALTDETAKNYFNRAQRNEERNRQKKVDAFRAKSEAAPPRAMVLKDRANPVEPVIFVRGNPGRRGERVPRRFLRLLAGENAPPFGKDDSGRLELAKAIVDPANPLTARVIVNRVWQHHFGEGIVRTPSDFGTRSEPPTHPELLDWLAADFVENGWSIKRLHRTILLSTAYQQDSRNYVGEFATAAVSSTGEKVASTDPRTIDPENRLLWRMNPRRLDFEAMRDAILAVGGRLDPALGGRPIQLFEKNSPRRTIYGYVNRNDLPGVWRSFDFPAPDASVAARPETTVPQQALFAMNAPFVIEQAKSLAARSEVAASETPAQKVTALYELALQRQPTDRELEAATAFLDGDPLSGSDLNRTQQLAQVLLLTNEFLFID